jgi:hypothetical protein
LSAEECAQGREANIGSLEKNGVSRAGNSEKPLVARKAGPFLAAAVRRVSILCTVNCQDRGATVIQ